MSEPQNKHEEKQQLEALHELIKKRDSVFARFPLLFTLLGTLGVTLTLFGFTHLIEKFPYMMNNPIIPLGVGLLILVVTGQLYKRLN